MAAFSEAFPEARSATRSSFPHCKHWLSLPPPFKEKKSLEQERHGASDGGGAVRKLLHSPPGLPASRSRFVRWLVGGDALTHSLRRQPGRSGVSMRSE
eukprot:scaffold30615_cov64-Phaeocystis_antarctica.AAC.4